MSAADTAKTFQRQNDFFWRRRFKIEKKISLASNEKKHHDREECNDFEGNDCAGMSVFQ
jgi:hypothetical protein